MALSSSAVAAQAMSNISGFDFNNPHNKSKEFIEAAAKGVVEVLQSDGLVIVNSHAGGSYSVTGVTQSAVESKIKGYMPSFTFTGAHSKAGTQPKAVAKAVADVVTSKAKINVPTDSSGTFPILYVTAGDIKSGIESMYIAEGFELGNEYCRSSKVIDALSTALADAITNSAKVAVNGVAGGSFRIS